MKRACCMIREALVYRRASFLSGLRAAGYEVVKAVANPTREDVLVIWNRYGGYDELAQMFERAGARVVVVENGYMGKSWLGDRWFSMALSQHAGGGEWFPGGPERWDDLKVELSPWRAPDPDGEVIILAQRGIGSPDVRSPDRWAEKTRSRFGIGRIREHPGNGPPLVPLERDLIKAQCVMTWASTAALHALAMGIPAWYAYPKWIGGPACLPLTEYTSVPLRDDAARLGMFQRLAWAMWRASEVEDGTAFNHLLSR